MIHAACPVLCGHSPAQDMLLYKNLAERFRMENTGMQALPGKACKRRTIRYSARFHPAYSLQAYFQKDRCSKRKRAVSGTRILYLHFLFHKQRARIIVEERT